LLPVVEQTLEVGRADMVLRGVAGQGAWTFASLASAASVDGPAVVEARRGADVAWHAELAGAGGPLATAGSAVFAVTRVRGSADGVVVHGEPGAEVVALDAGAGAVRWRVRLDGDEWVVASSLAATPDGGCVVGGVFSGTIRLDGADGKPHVVTSANRSDGFVARLSAGGEVAWLVRFGGLGADAVTGVAAAGDRVALVGTFVATAELGGEPLKAFDEHSPLADAVVAELELATGHLVWEQTFGGSADDEPAGVAIDAAGRVAVAGNARDVVHVAAQDLVVHGDSEAMVAWWSGSGAAAGAVLLGGVGPSALRGIAAVGDRVVVAGSYRGGIELGARRLTAAGGDDAFAAELDATGAVIGAWDIAGPGREDVVAVAGDGGGFVVGVQHTAAATVDGSAALAAPADPLTGAAVVVRQAR
jgi:hypothetical protein